MVSLRKLLPRFSLRTLVILPLLIGCMTAWYFRWTGWHLEVVATGDVGPRNVEDYGLPQKPVAWSIVLSNFTLAVDGQEVAESELEETLERLIRHDVVDHVMGGMLGERYIADVGLSGQMYRGDAGLPVRDEDIIGYIGYIISHSGESFASASFTKFRIWRRLNYRDVPWMRESWLTVLFSALLLWSILRDRKTLRKEQP